MHHGKKIFMRGLNSKTKEIILAIFEFSIYRGKIAKFRKSQIFEPSSALNYFSIIKISHDESRHEF